MRPLDYARGDNHTLSLHQSTDRPCEDRGRDALRSGRWGNADATLRSVAAWMPSAPRCACRRVYTLACVPLGRVDRGCRVRPRSRCRSSGHYGSGSGHPPSIPDGLAQSFRHDGSRNGSRCRGENLAGDAKYRSEQPTMSGRASLPNNEQRLM